MAVIECIELKKVYGKRVKALCDVNLQIEAGTSFGLLGENGAGKSTLVRILMGFIHPTSGYVKVLGKERVALAHQRIGYVHERPIFETRFTGRTYLRYLGELSGLWGKEGDRRIGEVLEQVQLVEAADRGVGTYSKGMLQRLAIAQALLMRPDLLVLDEPTSGLDPRSQWEVRQIVQGLRAEGKTLFICSHYLTEVEALCDTVGILQQGEMVLQGRVADLLQAQGIVEIVLAQGWDAAKVVEQIGMKDLIVETQGNMLRITEVVQGQVLAALVREQVVILSLHPVARTLEEVYVRITQNGDVENKNSSRI